jgi:hypothetical protein
MDVNPVRLLALPPELLHNIFGYLGTEDVLVMRQTCKIMARCGIDHFGTEVPLVPHRDKLHAVTEIAKHPLLSTRMRSLFYITGRLSPIDYETWVAEEAQAPIMRNQVVVKSHFVAAFKLLQAIYADQGEIVKSEYDLHCLEKLFVGCHKIRDVTVAYAPYCDRELNASRTAYGKATLIPFKGSNWKNTGVREVLNTANAAVSSGVKLDSLTLLGATYQLWDPDLRNEAEIISLRDLVRTLRRLRLKIQTARNYEDMEESYPNDSDWASISRKRWADDEAHAAFATGNFTKMLMEATNLRVLKLRMWLRHFQDETTKVSLGNALGDVHFPHLYDLDIGECRADTQWLTNAILRHKITLRRLTLSDIHLLGPGLGWRSVLTAIAGQLPNLRKIRLRGTLTSRLGMEFNFCVYNGEKSEVQPGRDDVENFVLKGGGPIWDHDYKAKPRHFPVKGYVPPGLPEDNTEPDDPKLDYEPDEFDTDM